MAPVRRSNPTPSHSSFIVAMPSPLACAQGASRGTSSAAGLARGHSRSEAARALCTEPHETAASLAYVLCVTAETDSVLRNRANVPMPLLIRPGPAVDTQ